MHLQNLNIRVKKYDNGFAVEIQLQKSFLLFWKKKHWVHIICVSGMRDIPWFYKTKETAIEEATKLFKWDLIYYSN